MTYDYNVKAFRSNQRESRPYVCNSNASSQGHQVLHYISYKKKVSISYSIY